MGACDCRFERNVLWAVNVFEGVVEGFEKGTVVFDGGEETSRPGCKVGLGSNEFRVSKAKAGVSDGLVYEVPTKGLAVNVVWVEVGTSEETEEK